MPKKVPNIQRIINNDILKIINIVFSGGGGEVAPAPRLCTSLSVPYLFFYLSKGGFPVLARSSSQLAASACTSN